MHTFNNTLLRKYLFVASILITAIVIYLISQSYFDHAGKKIANHLINNDIYIASLIDSSDNHTIEYAKLKHLFIVNKELKNSFYSLADRFNTFDSTYTFSLVYSSIIFGILGFLLLKKGWDNTESYYLKAAFLCFFFITSFFGIIPKVFQSELNYRKNYEKYNFFNAIQMDIFNLSQDNQKFFANGQMDSINVHINEIVNGIKSNQNIYFDKNIEAVPTNIQPTGN